MLIIHSPCLSNMRPTGQPQHKRTQMRGYHSILVLFELGCKKEEAREKGRAERKKEEDRKREREKGQKRAEKERRRKRGQKEVDEEEVR